MTAPTPVQYQQHELFSKLDELCQKLLTEQSQITIAIAGNVGSGKSTLGKQLRKNGLEHFSKRKFIVIDDSVASVPLLFFFSKRVTFKAPGIDNLEPFKPYSRNKLIIVYINREPKNRVERCDIIIRLFCDEELRRNRLIHRNSNGAERHDQSMDYQPAHIDIANYCFDVQTSTH